MKWRLDRIRPLMDRRGVETGKLITIQYIVDKIGQNHPEKKRHWATIQRYVTNTPKRPNPEIVQEIAEVLGVPTDYFADYEEDIPPWLGANEENNPKKWMAQPAR